MQRAAPRRGTPPGLPDDHCGRRGGAPDLRGGRHRNLLCGHGDPGPARAERYCRRAPRHLLAGADAAVLPAVDHPRRVRPGGDGPNFTATDDCTVVLLPARRTDRRRRRSRTQHEGHRADRRLHRRQTLPADLRRSAAGADRGRYHGKLEGKTVVVFGGSYGIGGDIADLATQRTAPTSRPSPGPAREPTSRREPSGRGAGRCWPRPGGSISS